MTSSLDDTHKEFQGQDPDQGFLEEQAEAT